MHRAFLILGTILIACAAPAQQAEPSAQSYAGSETCGICHEDTLANFRENPHYLLETGQRGPWEGRGCEACHGPGAEHSETIEAEKIFRFGAVSRDRVNRSCLSCHAGEETHRGRLFGAHNRNTLDCLECHSIHQSAERPLLVTQSDSLCSSCHLAARAEFNRPFRHKLQENAIHCVDCHNPHGGPPPAEMRRVSANEPTCLKCHADKRGPFPFEHAPVKLEPCSVCHEPHGSVNPRMMVRHEQSQLCLECHAGSFSTLGGVPPAFHDLRSSRFQNCTVCHSKIHGSFINRDFLR